ncbi:aminotransferase class I/II-fold pyridoxal phosphate-dependent enzyme [Streptomyces antimycoticus]|uniref:MalY/PatB family protein n=1 Tax=Streptomyces antimycoticus TaxID=68175 RepID=UPI003446714B
MTPAGDPGTPGFDDVDLAWLRARGSVKWHRPDEDVLPAWVADMDFPTPPPVVAALREAIDRRDLGYPDWPDGSPLRAVFARRMAERYGWAASADRVREQTDLIQCLQLVLHLATSDGDAVAVQVPNYPPFLATLRTMNRQVVPMEMEDTDEGWRMDFAALDSAVKQSGCKALVLVNPHNPTGRVLTRDELGEIAAIARRHDLLVISDEIHADLTYAPHRHIPFASLSDDATQRTVTLTSATKGFNLAAVRCAVTHYGPDRLLALRDSQPPDLYGTVSPLGVIASQAAWEDGDAWHRDLLSVLDRNRRRVHEVISRQLPLVRHHLPEATYLGWLDTRPLNLGESPVERVLREGRVLLDGGAAFGSNADGFLRLNFATSQQVLDDILERVTAALGARNGG